MIVRFYAGEELLLETRMTAPPAVGDVVTIRWVVGKVMSRVWRMGEADADYVVTIVLARQKGIAKAKGKGKGT